VGSLTFEDKPVKIAPGETVLTALLAAGVDLPNSCRAGACQTCLVQAVEGNPPAVSQQGLPGALKAQGYLMACVCVPQEPMRIVRADGAGTRVWVSVRGIERLSPTVVRLRLEPEAPFLYRSGQFLALEAPDGTVRHYSIASQPDEDSFLELHVRVISGGKMSRMIVEELSLGDRLAVSGPRGSCFYEDIEPDQPLVLAGTGTGLAPLWGMRDALRRGHHGPIRLYHGARDRDGLYHAGHLRRVAEARKNFCYQPCVFGEPGPNVGDLAAAVIEGELQPAEAAFLLCGDQDLVGRLKRALFLKGAKLGRLRADAFLAAA
jgi:CDP-4-dehydro-6-deoxyglucose reductase, E3